MGGYEHIHGSNGKPLLLKVCSYLTISIGCQLVIRRDFDRRDKGVQGISVLLDLAAFGYPIFKFREGNRRDGDISNLKGFRFFNTCFGFFLMM